MNWYNWFTISKIVLLKARPAMAAEVVGASVLAGILDLVLGKTINVEAINQRIDVIIKYT